MNAIKSLPSSQIVIKHKISKKNKWLNPTDSFGKFEKGVVRDSETCKRK